MALDQSAAPVLDAIRRYHERGDINFTPPGHRGGLGLDKGTLAVLGESPFLHDIDMLNGLDDRQESTGVLAQAQELMAQALGVRQSYFATCGSTLSVKTAFLALADLGEKVIVARNSHKSVIEAVILSGVNPVFAPPQWDKEWEISHPPSARTIARLLDAEPDAKAVFLVSPTDYGVAGELDRIAAVCHERGKPLVVDEAWAAHFPWHCGLPVSGIQAGADLVIHSVHKSGTGLLQASVLLVNGDLVDADEIGQRMDLMATTSASTPIYASIDGWRRYMALHGEAVIDESLYHVRQCRSQVSQIPGLTVLEPVAVADYAIGGLDPYKLTVDVSALGTTGFEFAERLRDEQHVNILLGNRRRITAMLAPGDDRYRLMRLADALRAVAEKPGHDRERRVQVPPLEDFELELAMPPREAFFSRTEQVPAQHAAGRVCAEMISPYPPGIPVVVPGERITAPVMEYLASGAAAGFLIPDAADPTMQTVRVVAEGPGA
jgi:arginine/lysine/ornithine decarboxylase